jgi:diguanylate cyclase (GGDEF)-like protein/PAS domain S-box-containing protein
MLVLILLVVLLLSFSIYFVFSSQYYSLTIIVPIALALLITFVSFLTIVRLIKRTEAALERMEKSIAAAEKETATMSEFHHSSLSSAPIGLVIFDEDCKLVDCNKAILKMVGISKEEYLSNPDLVTPEFQPDGSNSHDKAIENMKRVFNGENLKTEWLHCSIDGDYIPCELSLFRIRRKDRYFGFGYFYDLRNMKKFEIALDEAEQRVKLMLDACPLSCQLWNSDLKLVDCNEASTIPFELHSKQEYLDRFWELSPEYQGDGQRSEDKCKEYLKKTFMEGKCTFDWLHQMPDGSPVPCEVTLVRVKYKDDYVVAGYTRDLRILKKLEEKAGEIYYDPLTNIYNRRYFEENMNRTLKILSRSSGILSILMIDIDNFQNYNDKYGHSEGDNCLKTIANTISKSITRDTDFIARFSGQEFVVVLPHADRDGACMIAEKFINKIRDCNIPHEGSDVASYVTISIGVATGIANHTQTGDDYIKRAEEMLAAAKKSGRDRFSFNHL